MTVGELREHLSREDESTVVVVSEPAGQWSLVTGSCLRVVDLGRCKERVLSLDVRELVAESGDCGNCERLRRIIDDASDVLGGA